MSSTQPSGSSRLSRLLSHFRNQSSTPDPTAPGLTPQPADPCPQGLDVVANGIDPVVDIVAVHGLNGHRDNTWIASNGVHWLRDLLPHDLPRARILCWGYDANTHSNSRVSCQYLYDHARTLVSDLCRKRRLTKSTERPIIFIAHSLGGIIVKSALIHSDAARQGALQEHRSVKVSTYGIFFMGTPHQGGSGVQLGKLLVNVASLFVVTDDRLLKHLERDSEWLQQQLGQYGPISGDFVTKFAYEEYETPTVLGHSIMVVPRASAVVPGQANAEPIAIPADHKKMVKFSSGSGGYNTVSEHLQIMAEDAGEAIRSRWDAEKRSDEARRSIDTFSVGFSLAEVHEVDHFVAREEELNRMHETLGQGDGRRTVIVHGLGGMGKTQLAIAYAKRYRADYSAILWLNGRDEVSLRQSFVGVAERVLREHLSAVYLKNAVESRDLDAVVQAVKRWLDEPKNSRWLIVYDNYDNPQLDRGGDGSLENTALDERLLEEVVDGRGNSHSKAFNIEPFLPDVYQGAVIVTTRSSQLPINGNYIQLDKLENVQDSIEILSHASGRKSLSNDVAALELARELDGLPLALSTAGAYLKQVTTTFAEYLQLYRKSWLRLQKMTPKLASYRDRALYSTWNLSYDYIRRQNKASAMLLRLWAYFDNEDVWFELLREGRSNGPSWFRQLTEDMLEFNAAMRVLCDHGLVNTNALLGEPGAESGGYGIHNCVHSWTMYVLNESRDVGLARLAMRCIGGHVPEDEERGCWTIRRRLVKHADRCSGAMADWVPMGEGDEWVPGALATLYANQGLLREAEDMYERALRCKEAALGPDHISVLNTVNDLGRLYQNQGRLAEAEAVYERALRGFEAALGPNHELTLRAVNNLGLLYTDQGRLSEAEAMYERALQGHKTALGPERVQEYIPALNTVNNLGNLYVDQGRLSEAEAMYQRALRGYEAALGPEGVEVYNSALNTASNLGSLYRKRGRLVEAEAMYEWVLRGYEAALGPERIEVHLPALNIIGNLGNLFAEQGRLTEAEAMYEWVLRGYEAALGPERAQKCIPTLNTIKSLSLLYKNQGRLAEAEAMYERALRGYEEVLGPNHTLTLGAVNDFGILYKTQGRLAEAEAMYQRALRGYEAVLGPDHASTLDTVYNLGCLYQNQGRLADAEAMYERALRGYEAASGPDHISAFDTANNLGLLYADQGRLVEAEAMYKRALRGYEAALGPERIETYMPALSTMGNLANLYTRLYRAAGA